MKDTWKTWPVRGAVLGVAVVAARRYFSSGQYTSVLQSAGSG